MSLLRPLALLLALAAGPVVAQEVIVTNPAARPLPAPATTAINAATAALAAPDPTADADVLPRGAPTDDYEFVGWCSGILSGHMELFGRIKPELDVISRRWNTYDQDQKDYAEQRAAGQKALSLFSTAMRAAESASPREISPRGQMAMAQGVAMWRDINTVDKTNQAYSWLNWGLPARCEKVAADLEKRSTLAAAVLRQSQGVSPVAPSAPALPRQ